MYRMLHKKEKVFIITFAVPYPPTDGGKIAIFSEIDYLRKFFDITVLFELPSQSAIENINVLKTLWSDVNIETISRFEVPKKQKSFRTLLKNIGRKVLNTLVGKEPKAIISNSSIVEDKIKNIIFLDETFVKKVEDILIEKFPIIIVEYSTYLSIINILPKDSFKVFVEIESRFSIVRDIINAQGDSSFYSTYLLEACKNYEYTLISKYDAIIALTHEDKNRIKNVLPNKEIIVSPFPVLATHITDTKKEWFPEKLVFLGSENHLPNKDAVDWFITRIFPLLNTTDIKLFITGNWSIETKTKYTNNSRIIFTGFVDNLSDIMRNSICVVPIRLGGGGIRSKILESLSYGTPVISTTFGASGILAEDDESILIKDLEEEFAEAIDWAIKNPTAIKRMIKNGFKLIKTNYTPEITGEQKRVFLAEKIKENQLNAMD